MIQTNSNHEKGMQWTYIIIYAAVIDTIMDIPKNILFYSRTKQIKCLKSDVLLLLFNS